MDEELNDESVDSKKNLAGKAADSISEDIKSGNVSDIKKNITKTLASELPGGETTSKVVNVANKVMEAVPAIRNIAGGLQTLGSSLVAILGNPITWIIVLILVLALYVWNLFTFIGRNDNADGCYGIGGMTTVTYSQNQVDTSNSIMAWLTSNNFASSNGPMNKIQASSLVGVMWEESGLNPSASTSSSINKDSTNVDIKNLGSSNGIQIGLLHWDGSERLELAEYADSNGKEWDDLQLQLDFIKSNIEESSVSSEMKDKGFDDASSNSNVLISIFNEVYSYNSEYKDANDSEKESIVVSQAERANDSLSNYSGNYTSNAGGSCLLYSVDTSDAVQLAISMAYPLGSHDDDVASGDPKGLLNVLPAYADAKAQAEAIKPDGSGLYASCDKFVGTIVLLTMDPDFPWGHTGVQYEYLNNSSKWQRYDDYSLRQPGDVWVTVNRGHIVFYLGEVGGEDLIAHASFHDRVGGLDYAEWIGSDFTDTLGRKYAGFRYVGG